ncbi:MAG: ABC-F family ATP-binding cassette domain-containing protein [Deltaproteobacteria bacterium]|nr:ABC-F family ATP-binding cassette domain-containing protein [Deltaproteobacteria bacterium]
MTLLTVEGVSKSYGGRDLFDGVSLQARPGTKMALIGPNGCGKTTFLRILAGEVSPDSGAVRTTKGSRLGYVRQELGEEDLKRSLMSFVMAVLPSWSVFWCEWEEAIARKDSETLERLAVVQSDLEHEFGYNPEHRAQTILHGLGFAESSWSRPLAELSGGWRERAKLARVLLAGSDLLLLDEPTNHLDMEAVQWLEQYLLAFEGVLVFVAHDRIFLDRVSREVLFFDGVRPTFRSGNFSEFLDWSRERDSLARKQAARLESEIQRRQRFVDRFRYKATKAAQAQSRVKGIERLERELSAIKPPGGSGRSLSFSWPEPPQANRLVVSAVDVGFDYDGSERPILNGLNFNLYRGQKVALVGVNGAGKSTLLKLVTGHLRPARGQIKLGSMVRPGYFSQHQAEILRMESAVISEIRRQTDPKTTEQELRSVLGLFMLGEDYWEKKVRDLSGGEKNRLVLSVLFLSRANFLILDEPTNHLDIESREALISALEDYSGTLLIVAHDRHLLSRVADQVWVVSEGAIDEIQGGFNAYLVRQEAASAENAEQIASKDGPRVPSRRDTRRKEAEERNRMYRLLRPKQEEFRRLEAELEAVLEEHGRLERVLADPATYGDSGQLEEMTRAYRDMEARSEELMTRLAYIELDIQEIESFKDAD